MRLAAFCEAPSDFRLASTLIDRVLREKIEWVSDVLAANPDGIRTWVRDGEGHDFFDVHRIKNYALPLLRRLPLGHFNDEPGGEGALAARTAFLFVRALNRTRGDMPPIDGVVFIWDMDRHSAERRLGLDQARAEAERLIGVQVVLGRPDRMREAWVLAGFEPETQEERDRLAAERQLLGFQPNVDAHRLQAGDKAAKLHAKRVLAVLTGDDYDREERCWTETDLDVLRVRGQGSGLTEFLEEIEQRLVPLCR